MRFQLAGGQASGKQLISAAAFGETHEPQTIVRLEGFWKIAAQEAHFFSYGMGWFLHDSRAGRSWSTAGTSTV